MKGTETLRALTSPELQEKARALRRELFALRMQRTSGRVENPGRFRQARREIARILTILGEKD